MYFDCLALKPREDIGSEICPLRGPRAQTHGHQNLPKNYLELGRLPKFNQKSSMGSKVIQQKHSHGRRTDGRTDK
jgi:hypothetical protein